jgi:hypothetical protein
MSTTLDRWWLWVVANLLGLTLFVRFAARTWIEPELANEPGASGGEFMVWGLSALPILLLFILAHFAFGFVARGQRQRSGSWRGEIFVGYTLLCWIAAFLFDNAHHGI